MKFKCRDMKKNLKEYINCFCTLNTYFSYLVNERTAF